MRHILDTIFGDKWKGDLDKGKWTKKSNNLDKEFSEPTLSQLQWSRTYGLRDQQKWTLPKPSS